MWERRRKEKKDLRVQGFDTLDNRRAAKVVMNHVVVPADHMLGQVDSAATCNAIEAMQNSATRFVTLRLTTTQDRCILRFSDTGPGIAPELLDRVGTPFVTSKADGLGVGLAISRAIAEKHGGTLTITNSASGGACVTLDLPRASSP